LVDGDGDGRLDLLSGSNCCDPSGFIFFRRKEDGAWEPRRHLQTKVPNRADYVDMGRSFLTAADWNGDGVPDLLWMESKDIRVAPGPFLGKDLLSKDPIPLTEQIEFRPKLTDPQEYIADFAVADWDGDKKPDLLVRSAIYQGTGTITWYRNLGGPGLTRLAPGKPLLRIPPNETIHGFCVCDWNADGRADLMVTRFERLSQQANEKPQYRESVWLYPRE
jgi:hypothetical protein